MFYWWDPTYILVVIAALISMAASARVNRTYSRYAGVRSTSGMTGAEAARRILQYQGIYDVSVERVAGNLTDHYDPRSKVLRLSDATFGSSSVAAVGVAAHECGHAIQDAQGYAPLKIRGALVPVANLGATLSWPLVLIGLLISRNSGMIFIKAGIILFCAVVLFQLVTLPVEFNASSRGLRLLTESGILYQDEAAQTKKVLSAAAMTYVASVAASLLQLLRLLLIARSRNRD
ncbi:zinc metallopeptidase [Cuneatibacter sp. NSJ-177]|uniref:zinc metallopeptidase n=1 Tax=Cuneatibacter sp. NSJ-177 TaxID=2931401 RepID=UPI001FD0AFEC|nr:zinc metallopeptidase [Cuneatibacter sp. NSJ-177]MCJ7834327.1 zinc metallopeptidase [Cuneatibacter sp. NSJ-177]